MFGIFSFSTNSSNEVHASQTFESIWLWKKETLSLIVANVQVDYDLAISI